MIQDIKWDSDDFVFVGGDFSLTESSFNTGLNDFETVFNDCDQSHIEDILASAKGDWKESPLVGVNLFEWVNSPFGLEEQNTLRKRIRLQLELDGFEVRKLELNQDATFELEAIRVK